MKKLLIKKFINRLPRNSWLDATVISIFFIALTTAFFFFLRKTEYITIRLRVTQSDGLKNYLTWDMPPHWYTQVLKPGMEDRDFIGRSIIRIERVIPGFPEDNEQKTYIDLRIQALYSKQTQQYSYNGIPLLIGSYQRFKVNGIQIPGVIHAVGAVGNMVYPQKKYVLRGFLDQRKNDWSPGLTNEPTSLVEYDGINTYLANKIQKDMNMYQDGKIIAQIIELYKSPAVKKVIQNGQTYTMPDPDRVHVELAVKVTASIINNRPYFKDDQQRLLVNSSVPLDFGLIKPAMTITDIQEAE